MKLILTIFLIYTTVSAFQNSEIVSARIETCRGCSLNRLPEVKQFIMKDAPDYDRLEVEFITGAPPEVVYLGASDIELGREPLSQLNRQECNKLIQNRGFTKKAAKSEF